MNGQLQARRRVVVPSAALALVVSLIGGLLVLILPIERPADVALGPVEPAVPAAPAPQPEVPADLSMFGLGESALSAAGPLDTSSSDFSTDSAGFSPAPSGGLPSFQLPSLPPPGPAAPPLDWNALLEPLVQYYVNAQAANIAGSITGSVTGAVVSTLNSAAIIVGDLILFGALSNNGQGVLTQLQTSLSTLLPAAAATLAAQGVPTLPGINDLSGLATAFAAAAAAPPIGVPALPALPQLPQLPTPEQVAAGLAGLSALSALPAIPAIGLPGLPPPPNLPKPEEVVGGAVALGVGLVAVPIVLGLLFPPPPLFAPPSITRMMGLPF